MPAPPLAVGYGKGEGAARQGGGEPTRPRAGSPRSPPKEKHDQRVAVIAEGEEQNGLPLQNLGGAETAL